MKKKEQRYFFAFCMNISEVEVRGRVRKQNNKPSSNICDYILPVILYLIKQLVLACLCKDLASITMCFQLMTPNVMS